MKPLFLRNMLAGVICAALASVLLLLAFAAISLKMEDPAAMNSLFANIALLVGSFLGGRIAARGEENRALRGLLCGVAVMLAVLMPSLILSGWGADSLLRAALTVLASVLGAVLLRGERSGAKRRSAAKRRRINQKYGKYAA